MIRAREGEPTPAVLSAADVAYLARTLGRDSRVESSSLLVRRKAGLWLLPSGSALLVEPRKGSGADLFAWICAVDPRYVGTMGSLSLHGADDGSVAEVAVRAFCASLRSIQRRYGARQDYRQQPGRCAALRGRVDWLAYAREPLPVHVPCIYWQRQLDTPLNRMFAAVLDFARQHELLRRAGGAELRLLADIFGHVPAKCPPEMFDLERPLPRAETGYESLRRLAVLILDGAGLACGASAPGLQFEVNLARLSKDHLYQLLAYMKMVDARRGVLVYPEGAQIGSRRYCGTGAVRWEIRVMELDPVRIGREGDSELRRLGTEASSCWHACGPT